MRVSSRLLRELRVLALESSADDSCCSIVSSSRRILSNVVIKQHDIHGGYQQFPRRRQLTMAYTIAKYGGIHPIKSQDAHANNMVRTLSDAIRQRADASQLQPVAIKRALTEADMKAGDIDLIAYTRGPGMYGTLSVCAHSARAMAAALDKPIVGVHHMQAHALTPTLTEDDPPSFPFLTLLVSGGHTLLVLASSETDFRILAKSLDDSVGDAFDKTARLLQIPWLPDLGPGPSLEQYALPHPDSQALYESIPPFSLPTRKQLAFSFAGLKTNVERVTKKYHSNLKMPMKDDLKRAMARRFQEAAIGHLEEKVSLALDSLDEEGVGELSSLVASGGVASNSYLRSRLRTLLDKRAQVAGSPPMRLVFPPVPLCTDNAAMIAWAGYLRFKRQDYQSDPFDQPLRPKWSLEDIDD